MTNAGPFYYRMTEGIRITVRPKFLPEQSIPEQRQYVFEYNVRIENTGQQSAQLLSRRWRIHDSVGEDTVVAGDGVVGEQPLLVPGAVHQYQSFCVLKSANGHMEGEYRFIRADATKFEASIPRFELTADEWQGTSS
ncbi:MAG: Co2+/Mg2+ efflux protein ApaG [Gemmatimonadetes bacterium]|nr:Co2+/Mg2+ efflux protein ApaG [Gemmatimonadota bacterium]